MITRRLPVIARLRPAHESPEIWPLKAVALLVGCVIALSAACAVIADKAEKATNSVMGRVEAVVKRMDEERACARGNETPHVVTYREVER